MKKLCIMFTLLTTLAILLDSLCGCNSDCNLAIAPLLGAALVSGGSSLLGSVLGGLFGSSAQQSINGANIQMQRETNEMQRDLFNQNLDWTKFVYGDQKEYNKEMLAEQRLYDDPRNQVKRLKDAGLNPYMMLGNIDAGKFQTAVAPTSSAPSAPSFTAPHADAFNPADLIKSGFDTVGQTAMSYFRMQNEAEDAKGKHIDNITRLEKNRADIQVLLSNKKLNDAHRKNLQSQTKRIDTLLDREYDALGQSISMQKEEIYNAREQREVIKLEQQAKKLDNAYQEWFNDFAKQRGDKELQVLQSTIAANLSSANLNDKQAAVAVAEKIVKEAQAKGIKIDNFQKNKINWLLREEVKLRNRGQYLENRYGNGFFNDLQRSFNNYHNDMYNTSGKKVVFHRKAPRTSRW